MITEAITSIPSAIKLVVVFIFILFLLQKKFSIGNAFISGSVFVAILFCLPIHNFLMAVLGSLTEPKTIALCFVILCILAFSNTMNKTRTMQLMLNRLRKISSHPRLNMIFFPAVIGLLPMPGGAIFSAPMVKEFGTESKYEPSMLSFANYWFRHIWEFWWPFYPGILLASLLVHTPLSTLMLHMIPFTILSVYCGFVILPAFKYVKINHKPNKADVLSFIKGVSPLLLIVLLGMGFGEFITRYSPKNNISKEIGLILALWLVTSWFWIKHRFGIGDILKVVINKSNFSMVYMILGIMVFKNTIYATNLITDITGELKHAGIPLTAVCMILPFCLGVITGITVAVVGAIFPILYPLVCTYQHHGDILPYFILAYAAGYIGVLVSPLHLCLLLSNKYFHVSLSQEYRLLWKPALVLFLFGFLYFLFLKFILA